MNLKEREKIIKKEFQYFQNWEEKYQYLIELGEKIKNKSNNFRSKEKLITGCQSKIWLESKIIKNKIFFDADSDALIPKGILFLMIRLYSGLYPYEIIQSKNYIIHEIGLDNFLSPIRSNGIRLILNKMKFYALIYYSNSNSSSSNYKK